MEAAVVHMSRWGGLGQCVRSHFLLQLCGQNKQIRSNCLRCSLSANSRMCAHHWSPADNCLCSAQPFKHEFTAQTTL